MLTARNFTIFWYKYVYSYCTGITKYWSVVTFGLKIVVTCLDNFIVSIVSGRWSCAFASIEGHHQAFTEIRNKTI